MPVQGCTLPFNVQTPALYPQCNFMFCLCQVEYPLTIQRQSMVVSEYLNLLMYDPMLIGRELAFVMEMHNILCEVGNKCLFVA